MSTCSGCCCYSSHSLMLIKNHIGFNFQQTTWLTALQINTAAVSHTFRWWLWRRWTLGILFRCWWMAVGVENASGCWGGRHLWERGRLHQWGVFCSELEWLATTSQLLLPHFCHSLSSPHIPFSRSHPLLSVGLSLWPYCRQNACDGVGGGLGAHGVIPPWLEHTGG